MEKLGLLALIISILNMLYLVFDKITARRALMSASEKTNRSNITFNSEDIDSLTGIYNKSAFSERVKDAIESMEEGTVGALYVIDLCAFKEVNETLGMSTGDLILEDVAKKLCIIFSQMDIVGRIGGDDFAAFLKLSPKGSEFAENLIEEKARAIVSNLCEMYRFQEKEAKVMGNVGVSILNTKNISFIDLYREADANLYSAKEKGPGEFVISEN